ncbi:MAG TPA: SpoIIE family protein phosphatase [Limnochordia bacterium]|nr:SpoIIE family protein phosphatase [Limnochordia bacterium]
MAKVLSIPLSSDEGKFTLYPVLIKWVDSPFVWGIIGCLAGRAAIFGEIWPLGLAYIAVLRRLRPKGLTLPLIGVALGITSQIGLLLSFPYYGALAVLALGPGTDEKSGRRWLICSLFAIKLVLHYLLQPVPMVFIVAITECVFALFIYRLLYPALERCFEKQLAWGEIYAFILALTLIVSFDWSFGGISPRLFLISVLILLGARLGGLGVSCILGPALALLAMLLGEPVDMVLFIVIASLLTGFLYKFSWGYYVGPFLALIFSASRPVDQGTLAWFFVVLVAAWAAGRVPQERLNLLKRIIPGTESFQQQNKGYDEHLKKVFDQKIDGYLTVFEELETNLLDNENPLFHKQMHGMAELLKTMKTSFSPEAAFTKEMEEMLLRHFSGTDLCHITVLPTLDGFEIYGARKDPCLNKMFCQEVAKFASGTVACQSYGVSSCNCIDEGTCGFKISPCPRYKVEIGKAKVASTDISGDSQITFEIAASKVAIVLSDGMGVGLKAHTESNMTLRLLERMTKAGYDLATSVSLINRLLMLRNQDDMFVTIDMVVVDLFSGQLEFVKIGAAPSYIKRGREVEIIYNHALPVGVLSQVDVESDRRMLQEGEVLIMTTDGVLDAQRKVARQDEWMCWNLRRLRQEEDMSVLAEAILTDSIDVADGRIDDDMMVVVARLVSADSELESYRRVQSSV